MIPTASCHEPPVWIVRVVTVRPFCVSLRSLTPEPDVIFSNQSQYVTYDSERFTSWFVRALWSDSAHPSVA